MNEFSNNTQARKWLLTINNPLTAGLNHSVIVDLLVQFHPAYFCLADEIATTGTFHTHVYLYSHSPIRFGTVKRRFPTAHIDKALGSSAENRDYIRKEGKWAGTDKVETQVADSFLEYGAPPSEEEEKAPKMYQLIKDVEDGFTTPEIIRSNPSFALKGRDIDDLRVRLTTEKAQNENRKLMVYYLFGAAGTGKTRSIMDKYPAKDVCRITDYGGRNGVHFDAYISQPVLVFEEYHSQIPIAAMLNYLDIYPVRLPARYSDKVACYDTVYITSNIPLDQQYRDVQRCELETWRAFLRRIHKVVEFRQMKDGSVKVIEREIRLKN